MLNRLCTALFDLPDLLEQPEIWSSILMTKRKPHTYRIFTELPNGLRLCLHRFEVCDDDESVYHPHAWPGAFKILSGQYKMLVGYSKDRISEPEEAMTIILQSGSSYEMCNPLTWHAIIPLELTYTVMVTGEHWNPETVAHTKCRTTKGKNLPQIPEEDLAITMNIFKELVRIQYGS